MEPEKTHAVKLTGNRKIHVFTDKQMIEVLDTAPSSTNTHRRLVVSVPSGLKPFPKVQDLVRFPNTHTEGLTQYVVLMEGPTTSSERVFVDTPNRTRRMLTLGYAGTKRHHHPWGYKPPKPWWRRMLDSVLAWF